MIRDYQEIIPSSVTAFFLTEFNDIKTKSYTEAISPIIALIDEVEMLPVFRKGDISGSLKETIQNNFLTIFSLNRVKLGESITKTISGLVMEQLFTLVQNHTFSEHIIFIVDEVPVVENFILGRFLAEARKYHTSLILAGQYFSGISGDLQKAIFANVMNYYIFRLSKEDASILTESFSMRIPLKDTKEEKVKMITGLQNRECVVRICSSSYLLPPMKCRTLDFKSIPRVKKEGCQEKKGQDMRGGKTSISFDTHSSISLKDILITTSTSRKEEIK